MYAGIAHATVVYFALCSIVLAYPNGAPCDVVTSQQPGPPHGEAQTGPPPYGIRVFLGSNKVDDGIIKPNYRYTVEIYGVCGKWETLRGFLLAARNATTGQIIGRFVKDEQNYWQATHYPCRDEKLGAVTHFLAYDRLHPVAFNWVLEGGPKNAEYKDVRFQATIVQSLKQYWTGIVWPEPPENSCRCPDQEEFKKACLGYFRAGYCYTGSVKDELCPYTCNNCSGNVTLFESETVIDTPPDTVEKNKVTFVINGTVSDASHTTVIDLNTTASTVSHLSSSFSSSISTISSISKSSTTTAVSTSSATAASTGTSSASTSTASTTEDSTSASASTASLTAASTTSISSPINATTTKTSPSDISNTASSTATSNRSSTLQSSSSTFTPTTIITTSKDPISIILSNVTFETSNDSNTTHTPPLNITVTTAGSSKAPTSHKSTPVTKNTKTTKTHTEVKNTTAATAKGSTGAKKTTVSKRTQASTGATGITHTEVISTTTGRPTTKAIKTTLFPKPTTGNPKVDSKESFDDFPVILVN